MIVSSVPITLTLLDIQVVRDVSMDLIVFIFRAKKAKRSEYRSLVWRP